MAGFHYPDFYLISGIRGNGKGIRRARNIGAVIRSNSGCSGKGYPIQIRITPGAISVILNIHIPHGSNCAPINLSGLLDIIILIGNRRADIYFTFDGEVRRLTEDIGIFLAALYPDQFQNPVTPGNRAGGNSPKSTSSGGSNTVNLSRTPRAVLAGGRVIKVKLRQASHGGPGYALLLLHCPG